MTHRIFTGDEGEADALALMFEKDGFAVRWARHRPGAFIELEVSESPLAPEHLDRLPSLREI